MNPPILSIIIAAYNVEEYIDECLNSIYDLSDIDFEVIIVDDGSSDGTNQIIENYKSEFPNYTKVISSSRQGVSKARNIGINHATGKYISFIDSDDFVDTKAYLMLVRLACASSCEITIGDGYTFWNKDDTKASELKEDASSLERMGIVEGKQFLEVFLEKGNTNVVCWDKIYLREYLNRMSIRFIEGIIHEDVAFCLESLLRAKRVQFSTLRFYHYRRRSGSIMHTIDETSAKCRRYIVNKMLKLEFELNEPFGIQVNNYLVYQLYNSFLVDKVTERRNIINFLKRKLTLRKRLQCIILLVSSLIYST